jgi:hypothetical protein
LLDLNIEALKELGITTFGKRYKIMQAITLLKEESLPQLNIEVIKISDRSKKKKGSKKVFILTTSPHIK